MAKHAAACTLQYQKDLFALPHLFEQQQPLTQPRRVSILMVVSRPAFRIPGRSVQAAKGRAFEKEPNKYLQR